MYIGQNARRPSASALGVGGLLGRLISFLLTLRTGSSISLYSKTIYLQFVPTETNAMGHCKDNRSGQHVYIRNLLYGEDVRE